jgi:eukaryotic-like serine/threonine-protein kinase
MAALSAGARIGCYEVLRLIGAGGMGQVYRARDINLNRDVAIKILPDGPLADPEALARFRREAQVLAQLNHSNIATIHGLEETGHARALVMEFVEGRTLADAIAESPGGLQLRDAIAIARQIVDALAAAHDQGIIHRDLKPSNIIVRDDGVVKLLDFGLAKAILPGASQPSSAIDSPTMTAAGFATGGAGPGTRMGMIMGTAAYMAPEQAKGKAVDKRADIWALGVVLYEMATGRRLFTGENMTEVLAAVVRDTPDLGAAPPALRRLLDKCLEKDPQKRLRDVSGAALLLEDAETTPAPSAVGVGWSIRSIALGAVAMLAAVAAAATIVLPRRAVAPPHSLEFQIDAPPNTVLANLYAGSAVSPDGQSVVLTAGVAGKPATLWLRRLDSLAARALPGTEGASAPVWSPDGQSIAFMAQRKLKRLDLDSDTPVTLADVPRADPNHPGAWSPTGLIVFGCPCGLDTVPASGGPSTLIRKVDPAIKETAYGAPQFLPGGDRFIYFVSSPDPKVRGAYASSLADPSQRTLILNTSSKAVYVPPRDGRPGALLWLENQTLQARSFDAASLQFQGDPIAVAENVAVAGQGQGSQQAAYWTSPGGLLLYAPAVLEQAQRPIEWFSRDGKRLGEVAPEGPYNAIALSRDEQRVAVSRHQVPRTTDSDDDIWVLDVARKADSRITFGAKSDENPVWSPDGRQIAFSSDRDGQYYQLYRRDSSGAGEEERLTNAPRHMDPLAWSPDGRYLVYRELNAKTNWDLMLLPLQGDRTPIVLLQTPASDADASFSPDGKWLAYHSRMNGAGLEVFVQAFSGDGTIGLTGSRYQISTVGGGKGPLWRGDGRELYYNSDTGGRMMASTIRFVPGFQAERPRELFQADLNDTTLHPKAVTADGAKFILVLKPRQKPPEPRLTVLTDWQAKVQK